MVEKKLYIFHGLPHQHGAVPTSSCLVVSESLDDATKIAMAQLPNQTIFFKGSVDSKDVVAQLVPPSPPLPELLPAPVEVCQLQHVPPLDSLPAMAAYLKANGYSVSKKKI